MKKENKNENIWTREFNPSIDIIIKYIKIIAKYIYDKILTRWGIFLISLVGFVYIMINIYIYIYIYIYISWFFLSKLWINKWSSTIQKICCMFRFFAMS